MGNLSYKQLLKRIEKKCRICGESNYSLLDVHRIVPGAAGGKYTRQNSVPLCVSCHRKVHSGLITVVGQHYSTAGYLLHYFENGQEFFR